MTGFLLGSLGALLGLSWALLVLPRALLGTLGSVLGSLRASKLPRLPWLPGFLSFQAFRLSQNVCDRQLVFSNQHDRFAVLYSCRLLFGR